MLPSHPIFSCDQARAFEAALFAGNETAEWHAMQRAGAAIGEAVLRDFLEIGGFRADGRVLVLAGKGHNAGDALIAAHTVLERYPSASAEVVFALGESQLRPLAARAWRELHQRHPTRVRARPPVTPTERAHYELVLDGVFGFQFRPPASVEIAEMFAHVNTVPVRLRAAVDLPSAGLFRADFTYATGAVKEPALTPGVGRVRYLDLGFFREAQTPHPEMPVRVLTSALLAPLAELRSAECDKRTYGNVFLIGGSRGYPGAIQMAALAALRSGAGLVTAFVPESLAAAYAARLPEIMWVGWPETPHGSLSLEGQHLFEERVGRASSLVIGPGLGRERETLALVRDIVSRSNVPLVLDADALQPEIIEAAVAPRVLTPHAGEFARIAGGRVAAQFANETGSTLVLKGSPTRVFADGAEYFSFAGGPVLARGGSGDLLAGLIGGLLAQTPAEPALAAARGVWWHGTAADSLARAHGQTAVRITQLVDYLAPSLRQL